MQVPTCNNFEININSSKTTKPKQKFTQEEDEIILNFVQEYGAHTWGRIIPLLPERTPRQVRERYVNYLSPEIKRDEWTKDEDELILKLVAKFGKRWSYISRSFNRRTDVSIKNRYQLLKRKERKEFKKQIPNERPDKVNTQLQLNNEQQPFENQQIIDISQNLIEEEYDFQFDMFDVDNFFTFNNDLLINEY